MAYLDQPKDQSPTSYMDRMRKLLSPGTKRKLIQNGHKTFGVPLDELVRRAPPGEKIPRIVTTLCDFIQNNGIEQEGIFRISGSVRVLDRLKQSFDQTGEANLSEEEDVMAVAGLLKLFLRELPDSVVPESMTQHLIDLELGFQSKTEGYFVKILETLNKLPEENYNLLKYLLRFLVIVTQFEPSNKMSATALAIVFGPNIFRCGYGIQGLKDQGITNNIVCTFINQYDRLFKDEDEISPFSTKLIQVQGSTTQKTPPPRPPPPKIHAGEITTIITAPVAPPRKSKMRYDSSQYQDTEDLNSSDDSHSGVGTPKSRTGSNPFISPRLSEDESGRISPFVLDSENGHSIMDSPVVPVVASEIVEKTINQAISQYMFGYEGDASTTASSVDEMTRDSLENETPTPSSRLRKTKIEDTEVDSNLKSSEEDEKAIKVRERVELFQQQNRQAVPDNSLVSSGTATNSSRPKRQRPSSDAFEYFENQGIIIGSKVPTKAESQETSSIVSAPHTSDYVITDLTDGVSTNPSLHLLFSNPTQQNKTLDTVDSGNQGFQPDETDEKENTDDHFSQTLASYKRIQGPKNRRSPTRKARKSLNLDELDSDIHEVLGDNENTVEKNYDNSHHLKQNSHHHNNNHYKPYPDHGDWSYKSQNGTHYNNNVTHSTSPDGHKKHVVPLLDFTKLHEQIDKSDPIPIEQNGVKEPQHQHGIVIPLLDSSDEDDHVQSSEERFTMTTGVMRSPRTGVKFKKKSNPDELHQEAPLSPSAFKTSLTFSVPWNTDIAPSPPVDQGHYLKHSGPPTEEDIAAATKQIQRRIQFLKKTVKQFEDSFERENGHKPSHADKAANAEVKKSLVEITKAKKEIKKLKEEVGSRSRHSSGKSDEGSQDSGGSASIEKTLDLLLRRLKEKRIDACRPEDLTLMNKEQIQEEKLAVQKALLNFEGIHGRPASRKEKDLMRPLYDRYRTIKRMLIKPMSPRDELQTVPEDSPFELQPSTGHPGGKWDFRIPVGDEDDDDDVQEFGTSEFMVTRDMGLLRDTIRPITIERKDSPKVKRKILEETSDPGENIMGQSNLHELTMDELQDELQKAKQEKKILRKVLREFEEDFFRENGRKALKEDRLPLFNEYFEYKQVKARLRLLEALMSKYTPSSAV